MIEPPDRRAAREQPLERGAIAVERDVEHGDAVAGPRIDALEERDVALRPGDEHGVERRREPELVQCTEPVGVAVEDVERSRRGGGVGGA